MNILKRKYRMGGVYAVDDKKVILAQRLSPFHIDQTRLELWSSLAELSQLCRGGYLKPSSGTQRVKWRR